MVLVEKPIEVTLRGFSGRVELFPKRHAVELVEHRLVEAFADAIRLRAFRRGPRMVDVFERQIAFIRMPIDLAAVFRTAVRQDTTQGNLVRGEKAQHPIVQQISGRDRRLFRVELGEADSGVRVDEGLLINPTDAFEGAHVEGVLRAAVTGALALEFPVSFFVALRTLERGELRLREDATRPAPPVFPAPSGAAHGREIMAQPHAAYSARGK